MKTLTSTLASALRLTVLLAFVPALVSAMEAPAADAAREALQRTGSIPVQSAGPYVEPGTFLIQVVTKLGRPTARLSDDTWLYQNYVVENSEARGTLVVSFQHGRVSTLALVSPAVATAMIAAKKSANPTRVAGTR